MFELPEYITIASQINSTIKGKLIRDGSLGNSPHKFVWYNRTEDEFSSLIKGKTIGDAVVRGRWMSVPAEPGYVLLFGECGGKILYQSPGGELPKKYHLSIYFADGSFLTATTQMWGAFELYEKGDELKRQYVKDMRTTPVESEFTFQYFSDLIDAESSANKRSVKGLLTQEQIIPGLGNAIAQDIMFQAKLHPKHDIGDLDEAQKIQLYDAIINTTEQVIKLGGRYDEYDLYGNQGGYARLMDKNTVGKSCPQCGTMIEKMSYLGGTCYYCPGCQV